MSWPLVAHLVDREVRLVGRDAERRQMADDVRRHVPVQCDGRARPGCFSAFDVSMLTMRADSCGERRPLHQSMPGTRQSSTYCVRPVTCAIPS